MLKGLTDFFSQAFDSTEPEAQVSREHAVKVATALLMIEVARADYEENLTEDEAVFDLLRRFFELTEEEARLLVEEARAESDHAASLQSFTRDLHENLTLDEKHHIVEMMWRVAWADRHLDKHEDNLVRKIAGLLYISHSDLIRIRNQVQHSLGQA